MRMIVAGMTAVFIGTLALSGFLKKSVLFTCFYGLSLAGSGLFFGSIWLMEGWTGIAYGALACLASFVALAGMLTAVLLIYSEKRNEADRSV